MNKNLIAISGLLVCLTVFGGACQKEAEEPPSPAIVAVVDSVLSADSIQIVYEVRGTGDPALVFVHCWSCDRSYWDGQLPEFAATNRVVAIDLPGHGASGLGRADWTVEAFGADVAAVVEKLGLTEVVLVGHSMGGPVSLEAARRLGDRAVALVAVDTHQDFARAVAPEELEAWMAPMREDFHTQASAWVKGMFPADADSSLMERIAADMASAPPEVALSALRNTVLYDPRPTLAEIKAPIYCINSDKWETNVEGNRQYASTFEVTLMPGTSHFLQIEDPAGFNGHLRTILNRLGGRTQH